MLQEAGRIVNETRNFFNFPSIFADSAAPGSVAKYSRSQ
jgi:hypothetical protein